jgi:integrase
MGRDGRGVSPRGGGIQVSFTFEGQRQRRVLKVNGAAMAPTPANLKYAERLVAEIRQKIALGAFSPLDYFPDDENPTVGRGTTVAAQLDRWLTAQRIEASTRAGYTSAARFWKATLGDKALRLLRHSDILAALGTRPMLTGKTVNNYVSVLREACALAVLDRALQVNPVAAVPRARHQKEPPDPFSVPEAEAIIAHMRERYPAQVASLTEFRFFTGLRTSELAGLRWPAVDWRSGTVRVSEALVRGAAKARTKTNEARDLDLNSRALAALKAQKAHTFLVGQHVFLDPRYGTPWTEERAYRRSYWEPTLKALGLRYRRPYNTRHTYATMLLMAGARPAYAARQLGHSVEMFLTTYSKWIEGEQNAIEQARLEAFIAGPAAPAAAPAT